MPVWTLLQVVEEKSFSVLVLVIEQSLVLTVLEFFVMEKFGKAKDLLETEHHQRWYW